MMNDCRIGHGFDVHKFATEATDGTQKLGGIAVPVTHPLVAHSDGDVVLHAIADAILGALGLGDIGEYFPDTDAAYAGADSADLLHEVWAIAMAQGYMLGNVDVTIVAQTPQITPYKAAMKTRIAELLEAPAGQVNVKATTTERLGFVGRKEGIAVHAVVLLVHLDAAQ